METTGRKPLFEYFKAAFLGALILITIMYMLMLSGLAGNPGFVNIYHAVFGEYMPVLDHFLAALLFAISGGVWGLVFWLIPHPSPLKGMVFGLLPSLWLWIVVSPIVSGLFFNGFTVKGILLPLLFNGVIWGSFVGWYVRTDRSNQ